MTSLRRVFPLLFLALAATPAAMAAPAAGSAAWCGTHPLNHVVLEARHAAFERHLERERDAGRLPLKMAPVVYQVGNVAVIEDDGTIVRGSNTFDLEGRSMQFLRRPKGISAVRSKLDFKALIGDRLPLGDDDTRRIDFPAGFEYPFGDRVYTSVWINSDGNLTFGAGEAASTARSLQRLLSGPPRIAPLFVDLDPSSATGANGVYVNFLPSRVRITWLNVPVFGQPNTLNTFQVTLFDTGRANFAYDEVESTDAVVGIAPFGPQNVRLIDYDVELPFRPPQRVAIAEEFDNSARRDDLAASATFYEHYADVYDHLIFWLDFRSGLGAGTFAFESNVQNEIRGIGLGIFDFSRQFGSDGELRSFVMMGDLSRYPDDPDELFLGTNSTMGILGQETGHRWLAFTRVVENGVRSTKLLGRDLAHWSFHMDSEGSVMEGNDLVDNGDGTFTATDRATTRFSELDQYIMGLRPPQAVPDFFYVANPTGGRAADAPASNFTFSGDRVDVSVNQIIAAEGPRVPNAARSPNSFRMAFIVVGDGSAPVPQSTIDKVERIRARWVNFFQDATNNRGTVRTALVPK